MLLTPLLFLAYEAYARRIAANQPEPNYDEIDEQGAVIIAGIGRFGQVVNRLVRHSGLNTVVLDNDMGTIETLRRFGVKGYFGDPTRPELLDAAGIMEAEVLVVAMDDKDKATELVRYARSLRPDIQIISRARDRIHVYELYQAGANQIVRETFDSSLRAGRYVLELMGFTEFEAEGLASTYFRMDRAAVQDLADLWVPGERMDLNAAFVARAKELDGAMQTTLLADLEARRPKTGTDG